LKFKLFTNGINYNLTVHMHLWASEGLFLGRGNSAFFPGVAKRVF